LTVELAAIAAPSPAYEIRAARCRVLGGPVAPEVVHGVETLAGARMVAEFGRRVAEATGAGDGAALVVDAAIEIARLCATSSRGSSEAGARRPRLRDHL